MQAIIFVMVLIFIIMIAQWCTCCVCDAKIKFKKFKEFYELNPNRWHLFDDWVFCVTGFHIDSFHFGFIDYYRYKVWLHKCGNSNSKQATARMIKSVEQDRERNKDV